MDRIAAAPHCVHLRCSLDLGINWILSRSIGGERRLRFLALECTDQLECELKQAIHHHGKRGRSEHDVAGRDDDRA